MIDLKQRRRIIAAIVCAIIAVIATVGAFIYYHIDFPLVRYPDTAKINAVDDLSEERKENYMIPNGSGYSYKSIENIDEKAIIECLTKYTKRAVFKGKLEVNRDTIDGYSAEGYDFSIIITFGSKIERMRIGENGVVFQSNGEYRFKINDSAALRDELYEILGLEK